MSPEQKRAWVVLGSFVLVLVLFLVAAPFAGVWRAKSTFGLCGPPFVIAFLLFRKKRDEREVSEDERDRMISEKAWYVGAIASYTTFVAACFIPWVVYSIRGKEAIDVDVLNSIIIAGAVVLFVTRAIAVLVLYGREGRHGEN